MHTFFSRLNALFAYSLTLLALLTLCFALSTSYKAYESFADIDIATVKSLVRRIQDFNMPYGHENDLGLVQFDLDADFARCFDWNVKQIFIYLTAEYKTIDNKVNQVVLWDYIMQRGEPSKLALRNQNPKYYMWDDGFGLKGNKNVTLTVNMNVIPNAGFLKTAVSQVVNKFEFPDEYSNL